MTNPKFTPGPWITHGDSVLSFDRLKTIATTHVYSHGERLSDASLIAAAPEMYEALENLYDKGFASLSENERAARLVAAGAVLAKARGEHVDAEINEEPSEEEKGGLNWTGDL
jgi:hypothetical protein